MLYIRTDMNETIATGHMMRCLAIADAAKEAGEDTLFIVSDNQAVELLEKRGYSAFVLGTHWRDMESELPLLQELIRERKIVKILVDSYQVTYGYLKALNEMAGVIYIDDINAFIYPVDAVICYLNCWDKFDYSNRYNETELYLGPKYAPLRKEFCNRGKKDIKPLAENLLLMSGGSDRYNILPKILERLDIGQYGNIDVVCGIYNTRYEELKYIYGAYGNVSIHKAVDNMAVYMEKADLAVSAGGTTLYELCALGTPAISYSLADNQLDSAAKFNADGMIDYAGDVREGDISSGILNLIEKYKNNRRLRVERSEKMQGFVDGKGAARIADIMKK